MRSRYQQQMYRLQKLADAGMVKLDEFPTEWQIAQFTWEAYSFLTVRREEDVAAVSDTWLAKMPQRAFAQITLRTFFPEDPTGLTRTVDGIVWHLLSLNHYGEGGATYDLQMLTGFDGGLDYLEGEVKAILAGTHPRTWLARQMVGDDVWWPRLLEETRLAKQGKFPGASFKLNTVQGCMEHALSFPATPSETLQDSEALGHLALAPFNFFKHAYQSTFTNDAPAMPERLGQWVEVQGGN